MFVRATTRHPELVSGSIPPPAQVQRRQTKPDGQIMPIGVLALDEVYLPLSAPVLELFLASDRSRHVSEHLVPDEPVDFVPRGETFGATLSLLPQAFDQITRDPDVERPMRLACEDVDARVSLNCHSSAHDQKWTLKQVQGDESGLKPRHAELVSASICRLGAEGAGQ